MHLGRLTGTPIQQETFFGQGNQVSNPLCRREAGTGAPGHLRIFCPALCMAKDVDISHSDGGPFTTTPSTPLLLSIHSMRKYQRPRQPLHPNTITETRR